jgi:glyoxylase-like metal-dependent hydrolase (beta-lactamase superfamily II)
VIIETVTVGPIRANCHIIGDKEGGKAIVVDPGAEIERIMAPIKRLRLEVEHIVCTHGHFDHIGAVKALKALTGADVLIHKDDLEAYQSATGLALCFGIDVPGQPAPDRFPAEGDAILAGGLNFKVLHTPGHSPGGISIYGEGLVLTGDTLFAGSIGRTDLPGGDSVLIGRSLAKLMKLPDDTLALCGHGPSTTIGREREGNPFNYLFR